MGDAVNGEMMRDFRPYMLIGGMPQFVNAYLDFNDYSAVVFLQNKESLSSIYKRRQKR